MQESVLLGKQKLVPSGTSLSDLINAGLKDQGSAPTVLSALLEELGKQTQ
jgi:small subunit ribosomal protein S29